MCFKPKETEISVRLEEKEEEIEKQSLNFWQ